MDLSLVNIVAKRVYLEKKKLTDLMLDVPYKVSNFRQVKTIYGLKTVIEIEDQFQFFLPARFQRFFEEKPEQLKLLQSGADSGQLSITHLGNNQLQFENNQNISFYNV